MIKKWSTACPESALAATWTNNLTYINQESRITIPTVVLLPSGTRHTGQHFIKDLQL